MSRLAREGEYWSVTVGSLDREIVFGFEVSLMPRDEDDEQEVEGAGMLDVAAYHKIRTEY